MDASKQPRKSDLRKVSIARVRLENLFGLYTYQIPSGEGILSRTPILYGENGIGKTNILKALFHLLSPAHNRGHRTALNELRFTRVDIQLSNDVIVSAMRPSGRTTGHFRFEVHKVVGTTRTLLGAWTWVRDGDPSQGLLSTVDPSTLHSLSRRSSTRERADAMQHVLFSLFERESNPKESEDAFLAALRENVPPIYFLGAERSIRGDELQTPHSSSDRNTKTEMREMLPDALARASRRLIQAGIRAASQGSTSTHTIYRDLLKRLTSRNRADRPADETTAITDRLMELSAQYSKYARYGLTPSIDGPELVELLNKTKGATANVAYEILAPYVEGLVEQSRTLDIAYEMIDSFVSTTNRFLFDKRIEFGMAEGAQVKRLRDGAIIDPRDLSSGEQQLLLLFCHVVNASNTGGIFIVDEPEISLNVNWQRQLIDALHTLDRSGNLQFIFASHSMELLAKHRADVVRLKEVGGGRSSSVND